MLELYSVDVVVTVVFALPKETMVGSVRIKALITLFVSSSPLLKLTSMRTVRFRGEDSQEFSQKECIVVDRADHVLLTIYIKNKIGAVFGITVHYSA